MTQQRRIRRGPPLRRHVAAIGVIVVLMLMFVPLSPDRDFEGPPYLSHTVLADTSVALLCLILILGAGARFVPRLRPVVPWARELGIGMFVTGGLHVLILFGPDWEVMPFFGRRNSLGGIEFGDGMWAAANWVGLLALGYALTLAATSNDFSQRWLGRGWKFVQRQAYTLFVLVWLHTAAFVLLDAGHGSSSALWFWAFTAIAVVAQFAGFVHTVRSSRGPSPQRAPARAAPASPSIANVGAAKWVAVAVLWGGLILGSWSLATAVPDGEGEVDLFCERYFEVQDWNRTQMLEELEDYEPTNDPEGAIGEWGIDAWIGICGDGTGEGGP